MPKYRVHELAKEYNINSKTMINLLLSAGINVESHMSMISDKDVKRGREFVEKYLNESFSFEDQKSIAFMFLKNIKLRNFRCFEETDICFRNDYSVLVGLNGSGKTTILDAIAISLGSYLQGFNVIGSNKINRKDAYRKVFKHGSKSSIEEQYPISVDASAEIDGREISWMRQMNSERGTTLKSYATEMMDVAGILQTKIRRGSSNIVLPILSYYGTERLRNQNVVSNKKLTDIKISRLTGYENCLDSVIDMRKLSEWFADMTYIQLQEGKIIQELDIVRKAMEKCYKQMNDSSNECSILYKVKTKQIEISSEAEPDIPLNYLSDGYKSILFMVADIAYRMAILNPQLQEDILLSTPGIVLIDEIDLHLHPSWQKNILQVLRSIFPKVQFIVTTHSPSIIANVKKQHLIALYDYKIYPVNNETYGKDVDSILNEIMGTDIRPPEVKELISKFQEALDSDVLLAEKYLNELRNLMGDMAKEVVQGEVSLNFERMMQE